MEIGKILIIVDMEGIIGVADMKDVDANAELAYKEISIIISKLKSYNITHITVCNMK